MNCFLYFLIFLEIVANFIEELEIRDFNLGILLNSLFNIYNHKINKKNNVLDRINKL